MARISGWHDPWIGEKASKRKRKVGFNLENRGGGKDMSGRKAGDATGGERRERRKILVVGREDFFTEGIVDYAIHLAERLGYDILAANVGLAWGGNAPSAYQARLRETFHGRATEAGEALKRMATESDIRCEHVVRVGELGPAVEALIHEYKRIEFVVTESEANKGEVAEEVTIPVFSVITNDWNHQGGRIMANEQGTKKQRPWGKTIGFGVLSVACYAAVFANTGTVQEYFTKGGWYAALPIATVFAFSFVHGSFTSYLWSLLGIEARKQETDRPVEKKVVRDQKRAQKRPRAYAHINPFHRM
jgi:hypothetical protein